MRLPSDYARMPHMRHLKLRIIPLVLAFAVGFGVDVYLRYQADQHRNCFGCSSWHCVAVDAADHPLVMARVVWIMLTDR